MTIITGEAELAAAVVKAEVVDRDLQTVSNSTGKPPEAQAQNVAPAADFESAILAAGFGWFNYLLLFATMFAAVGSMYESSTISYVLASAECDLKLTLLDKGTLNAIAYAGMITSAIGWGYLADTLGRKKMLVWGFVADTICVLGSSMSQNVATLMVFKFFGGFVTSGPFAILMSYLAEMHSKNIRARILMITGMMFSLAALSLPALGLLILPNNWDLHLGGLTFHAWHIFLALSAIPSALSSIMLLFLPESPKFLMSQGRNGEAIEVFRTIYALNKHKPRSDYPIKELINEVPTTSSSNEHSEAGGSDETAIATIQSYHMPVTETKEPVVVQPEQNTKSKLRKGLLQLQPLFVKPYLALSLHVYLLDCFLLFGQNTMRLWLPQLFASIEEYENKMGPADPIGASMCTIVEYSVNKTIAMSLTGDEAVDCQVIITPEIYYNNIIVSCAGFISYFLAGYLVNLIGSKHLTTGTLFISGCAGIGLYWSDSGLSTLIISTIYVTCGSLGATCVISASANLFPTALRTMILSLTMMCGRIGSIVGNMLFPTLMTFGCIPPFLMMGTVMFLASIMSAFLPNTNKMALK